MQNQKTQRNLNELAKRVHQANIKWWQDPKTGEPIQRHKPQLLMLVITELAEAVEGLRKDRMDDHLPNRKMEEVEMADAVIRLLDYADGFGLDPDLERLDLDCEFPSLETLPDDKSEFILVITDVVCTAYQKFGLVEEMTISTAIVLIENYCDKFGLDLWGAFEDKMAYNAKRADHTHEARLQAGGKKF